MNSFLIFQISLFTTPFVQTALLIWVLRRNLPVPQGRLSFLRAYFWWSLSLMVGWLLPFFFLFLLFSESFIAPEMIDFRETNTFFAILYLSLAALAIGCLYGVGLQLSDGVKSDRKVVMK